MDGLSDWEVVTAQTPYTVRLTVPGGWLYYSGFDLDKWDEGKKVQPVMCFVPDPSVYAKMLKLDEPKSMEDKFNDAWCSLMPSERTFPNVLMALEEHGLKLVEK